MISQENQITEGENGQLNNDPFTTPVRNDELRRSERANKGFPPPFFGDPVSQLRQSRARLEITGENDRQLSDVLRVTSFCPRKGSSSSIISKTSIMSSSSQRKLRLEAELKAAEEIAALKESVIHKRLELEKATIDEKVENGCDTDDESTNASLFENSHGNEVTNDNVNNENNHDSVEKWVTTTMGNPSVECLAEAFAKALQAGVSMTTDNLRNLIIPSETTTENRIEKFLARQTNARDLPPFDGKPEQWPNFISCYQRSTTVCGFSSDENMARLQKSLRGEALFAVQGMMISPENLNQIMKVLERRFGRPDLVIRTLIDKARKTPSPNEDKLETLISFSNMVQNLVANMRILKGTLYMLNPELTDELASKMPSHLKLKWGRFVLKQSDPITLDHFANWLDSVANAASITSIFTSKTVSENVDKTSLHQRKDGKRKFTNTVLTVTEDKKNENESKAKVCTICDKPNHTPDKCAILIKLTVEDRWKVITNKRLCFHCLQRGCQLSKHSSRKECGIGGCTKFHHESLHNSQVQKDFSAHMTHGKAEILLRILPVTLKGPQADVDTYALLDDASTVTLLDDTLVKTLGLKGPPEPLSIQWTNSQTNQVPTSINVTVGICGVGSSDVFQIDNVHTMNKLNLPIQSVNVPKMRRKWDFLSRVDINSLVGAKPQILIGQDNYHLIAPREIIEGPPNAPVATKTKLGWVIHGVNYHRQRVDYTFTIHNANKQLDESLHALVKEHFKIESLGITANVKLPSSKDELRAEIILENTTRRVKGRWETGLLWKTDDVILPESRLQALRRLKSIEKKMDDNSNFAEQYCNKMQDFFSKGFARELSPDENLQSQKTWYLPHFAHFNPNKPGKLRLIFDAASRSNGVSLNDKLLAGPDLYVPLTSVLFRFRQRKIGFGGDIQEMFPQNQIIKEDLPSQRFLWRGMNRREPPREMVMTRMIFGAISSPCSAQFVKNRNAMEFIEEYPEAVDAILNRHYMDDYFDSTDTKEEALERIHSVIHIHSKGGFMIRNWTSSSKDVLREIPAELRSIEDKDLNPDSDLPNQRVLGINWNPTSDMFFFACRFNRVDESLLNGITRPTKRGILTVVMSIYDPLGFLYPLTIKGKILLQDIWREGISFDVPLTDNYTHRWRNWLAETQKCMQSFQVPRCYFPLPSDNVKKYLHVFCDASEKAMSTIAYITFMGNDDISTAFAMAKARVAPLAAKSIPRLELEAAVMACRLADTVRKQHDFQFTETHFWSDSKIVLCWIRSDSKKCKTYVAHRVGEIQETSDPNQWHWISTHENVADESTRDVKQADLTIKSRWLNGPDFLRLPSDKWPQEKGFLRIEDFDSDLLELKKDYVAFQVNIPQLDFLIVQNFSSWSKLIRKTAWVLRFLGRCRKQLPKGSGLSPIDVHNAELFWWKRSQMECFPEEVQLLSKGKSLPKSSRLYFLSPFIDDCGVIRVRGRTVNAIELSEWTKRPVILDPKHPYTILLGRWFHEEANHYGMETVANELRQRFWILHLRAFIKSLCSNCQFCKNARAIPQIPEMAPLPEFRVQRFSRAFTVTGVDYFGPLTITIGRRTENRYGCLFTCLSTRAVHLEIAETLTTDSAIMALRRFCSRRGNPLEIYSDNGTNFHGANNELRKAIQELNGSDIEAWTALKGIKWNFIPPGSPHMGGCWERLVRSVKTALGETLKTSQKLEVLATVMAEAECIVNSRPLTHVSLDHRDDEALTPNHFLIGTSSAYQPMGDFSGTNLCLRKRWRIAQNLADLFWKRWLKEYLPSLTRRTKWLGPAKPVEVGDVVIIADERLPRSCWPKGLVVRTIEGKDGKCRVADVRTKMGIFRRPVSKLCVLDVRRIASDVA